MRLHYVLMLNNVNSHQQAWLQYILLHSHLDLEADLALVHSVCTSCSGPHERKAGKRHRRCLEPSFINRQTQVTIICNIPTKFRNKYKQISNLDRPRFVRQDQSSPVKRTRRSFWSYWAWSSCSCLCRTPQTTPSFNSKQTTPAPGSTHGRG